MPFLCVRAQKLRRGFAWRVTGSFEGRRGAAMFV